MIRAAAGLLLLLLLGTAAVAAPVQGGYVTKKHPSRGIDFRKPKRWNKLPVQPTEEWIRFKLIEPVPEEKRDQRKIQPHIEIIDIPYVADAAPLTGGTGDAPAKPEEEVPAAEDGEEKDEKAEEEEPPPPPLNSWDRYLERELKGWNSELVETLRPKGRGDGVWERAVYHMTRSSKAKGRGARGGNSQRAGYAYVWTRSRERIVVAFGQCAAGDLDELEPIFEEVGTELDLYEPDNREELKWRKRYERDGLRAIDYRTPVRIEATEDGWKVEDTENYIVVYNTSDQPLVRRIVKDLENIRKKYIELFPPSGPIEAVSTVRICSGMSEYYSYGGPRGSAGYWYDVTEELVLPDATKRKKGEKTDKSNTFIILYHEALHQYIHYSAGKLSPHSWFNEGYGDYFSGSEISGGKVKRIGLNPWRLGTIKSAVSARKHVPLEKIIRYEQRDYYKNAGLCYAEGWSIIYFLNTSKVVARHEVWSEILTVYFETLKDAWASQLARLKDEGKEEDATARLAAQKEARVAAVDAAFEDVDIWELEEAWLEFVEELPEPK
ncbi:MAG: DUF1570 domain-containing protein [Planctomycetota bacterium]|nr:DUF1570 domain-containing protein [Planctomycetota bacterium]